MVLINFFYEKKEKLPFNKGRVRLWLKDVIKKEDKELGCVNFIYCSDEYLLGLNKSLYPTIDIKLKYFIYNY